MSYPQERVSRLRGEGHDRHADVVSGVVSGCDRSSTAHGLDAPRVGSGVMARDTGSFPKEFLTEAEPGSDWREPMASISDAPTLGEGLKAARLASGRSLDELSEATRVHLRYLTALEQNDWASLPSRVFVIGHLRAYAEALGLDEHLAVERFKRESPDHAPSLQAPVGVAFEDVRRYSPRVIAAIAAVTVALVGWNVFQRVSLMQAPHPSDIAETPESWTLGAVPGQDGALSLSVPQAAPPDQTTPVLYVTPGLEAQLAGAETLDGEGVVEARAADAGPVQKAFNPRGAVYGAAATASQVVLQARKAASIVVRMGDGRVLFARQLAAGEAWRAPVGVAATVDVSDPEAFDVYLNGEHGGGLSAVLTPLSQLNSRAQAVARQMAVQAAARAEAARDQAQALGAQALGDQVVAGAPAFGAQALPNT